MLDLAASLYSSVGPRVIIKMEGFMNRSLQHLAGCAALATLAVSAAAQDAVTLPAGTRLPVAFGTSVSSETSHRGDPVVAKTTLNVRNARHAIVIPAGSEVRGHVTTAYPGGKIKGRARLAVTFDRVVVRGESLPLRATAVDVIAPSNTKHDAAVAGATTIGGAVVGGILGGAKGARIGAATGAAGGVGVAVATRGKQVAFPAGMRRSLRLVRALRVPGVLKVPPLTNER